MLVQDSSPELGNIITEDAVNDVEWASSHVHSSAFSCRVTNKGAINDMKWTLTYFYQNSPHFGCVVLKVAF